MSFSFNVIPLTRSPLPQNSGYCLIFTSSLLRHHQWFDYYACLKSKNQALFYFLFLLFFRRLRRRTFSGAAGFISQLPLLRCIASPLLSSPFFPIPPPLVIIHFPLSIALFLSLSIINCQFFPVLHILSPKSKRYRLPLTNLFSPLHPCY